MEAVPYLAVLAALGALVLAAYFASVVLGADEGTDWMKEIGAAIREGAMAFLRREYRWVSVFVASMAMLIFIVLDYGRPWGAIAYILGAVFSSAAGFVGMTIATQANTRTANAARTGAAIALPLAFRGGAVMGFTVAGLGLFGIAVAYIVFVELLEVDDPFQVVAAFGLGGSSIALFARIGGGIYTKAADVGADLVGKVEAGIPEDDPRNPATIADNVGDNVGDVAGMGADLFESYAGSLVAPIVLASLLFAGVDADGSVLNLDGLRNLYAFPLLIGAFGMIASIIGALLTRGREGASLSAQLHRGQNVAMGLMVVLSLVAAVWAFGDFEGVEKPIYLGLTIVIGMAAGWAIGFTSEFFTSDHYRPVSAWSARSLTGR
jgi:K(+)-stimulated pyrophosphate-energized sodium pump